MPEKQRKLKQEMTSDLGLEGFEKFFEGSPEKPSEEAATASGGVELSALGEKLIARFNELITLTVDQRVETAKITNQLIENQRQLLATQQILIRLMERSLDLTRHITLIEEKLPAVFELPRLVEDLKSRLVQLEGVETR